MTGNWVPVKTWFDDGASRPNWTNAVQPGEFCAVDARYDHVGRWWLRTGSDYDDWVEVVHYSPYHWTYQDIEYRLDPWTRQWYRRVESPTTWTADARYGDW